MRKFVFAMFAMAATCLTLCAGDLSLAPVFTDHMVMQRETSAPVWGWADPGKNVTVIPSWDGKKYVSSAGKDGRWEVRVATPSAGGPYSVTVSAGKGDKVVLEDVLIGEVWLCSGQSNMALNLIGSTSQGVEGSYEAIVEAPEYADRIRFFDIQAGKAFTPQTTLDCSWVLTTGDVAAKVSAIGYFFAKRLTRALGVPVGIISNAWGGCLLPPWVPMDYMEKYVKGQIPQSAYENILERRDEPDPNREAPRQVATLYNSRLYPVAGYAIRGFVWYQGCSELIFGDIPYYDKLQAAMVRSWRDLWGDNDNKLPFYFTLIAPYSYSDPDGCKRGYFVENQLASLDIIPNSAVAVTETLGDRGCIHPARKKEVADQFAVLALERVYNIRTGLGGALVHPDVVTFPSSSSVKYRKIHQSGYDLEIRRGGEPSTSIVIHFADTWTGLGHYSDYGSPVKGFEVAGPDRVFHSVPAVTLWDTVVVDCSSVSDPVAVRYAFHNWTEGDLRTALGIPVASFRTDDWPM